MATTDRPKQQSFWQRGVDDARAGKPADTSFIPLLANDGWSNTVKRRGYLHGHRYGLLNPTTTESAA